MATARKHPALNVTIDQDIREELMRRKREESLNVSAYVNALLRPHFKKKPVKAAAK